MSSPFLGVVVCPALQVIGMNELVCRPQLSATAGFELQKLRLIWPSSLKNGGPSNNRESSLNVAHKYPVPWAGSAVLEPLRRQIRRRARIDRNVGIAEMHTLHVWMARGLWNLVTRVVCVHLLNQLMSRIARRVGWAVDQITVILVSDTCIIEDRLLQQTSGSSWTATGRSSSI